MSKNINVNPGQYKVAGRERQGEETIQPAPKKALKENAREQIASAKRPTPLSPKRSSAGNRSDR